VSNLVKAPFTPQRLEEERKNDKRKVHPVSLNIEEEAEIKDCQNLIHQAKISTAIKQLALIGAKCIQRPETKETLDVLFNNDRKNVRSGIHDFD